MRKAKINDPMTENGWIREDGRVMRDFYVVQVKAPAEFKGPVGLLQGDRHRAGRGRRASLVAQRMQAGEEDELESPLRAPGTALFPSPLRGGVRGGGPADEH